MDSRPTRSASLSYSSFPRHSSKVGAVCVKALVRFCAGGDPRGSSLPRHLPLWRMAILRQNAELRIRLLCSQMTIEELHDDIVSVSGFWNVGIVKETVEKSLPDVQFRVDT